MKQKKNVFATGNFVGTEQPKGLPTYAVCVIIRHSPSDCRSLSGPALPDCHFATVLHCMGCSVQYEWSCIISTRED